MIARNMFVCVCQREKERRSEQAREREKERVSERERKRASERERKRAIENEIECEREEATSVNAWVTHDNRQWHAVAAHLSIAAHHYAYSPV